MEILDRAEKLWQALHEVSTRIVALDIEAFDTDDQQTIARTGSSCLSFSKGLLALDAQGTNERESSAFLDLVEDFCASARTMLTFAERSIEARETVGTHRAPPSTQS